jgi:hypothetical protein
VRLCHEPVQVKGALGEVNLFFLFFLLGKSPHLIPPSVGGGRDGGKETPSIVAPHAQVMEDFHDAWVAP